MGYTHYWHSNEAIIEPEAWERFTSDVKRIFEATEVPLGGGDGSGEPVIAEDFIAFNGRSPEDYETMFLSRALPRFGFCKTAHRPYDEVVLTVMACAEGHFGLQLTSDGGNDALDEGRRRWGVLR